MSEYIYTSSGEPLANSDGVISLARKGIVRCRDCLWFCAGNEQYVADDWCKNFGCEVESVGFCAWGKRKEDELGEIVQCRDCENVSIDQFGGGWCSEHCREVRPFNFCAWGERKQ